MSEHGTLSAYTNGKCRCELCREAMSNYRQEYIKTNIIDHGHEQRSKRRIYALKILGNKCKECGSISDLQIDHINPDNKHYKLRINTKRSITDLSEEDFYNELQYCQLLCYNCHLEKSNGEKCVRV